MLGAVDAQNPEPLEFIGVRAHVNLAATMNPASARVSYSPKEATLGGKHQQPLAQTHTRPADLTEKGTPFALSYRR